LSRDADATLLDLILILGVPVEERLDFRFVDPTTQAVSELSLAPEVKTAKPSSEEFEKLFGSFHQKVTENISQHFLSGPRHCHSLSILLEQVLVGTSRLTSSCQQPPKPSGKNPPQTGMASRTPRFVDIGQHWIVWEVLL
jgi:hypothetical protein